MQMTCIAVEGGLAIFKLPRGVFGSKDGATTTAIPLGRLHVKPEPGQTYDIHYRTLLPSAPWWFAIVLMFGFVLLLWLSWRFL